jgi:hypothetical protein
VKTVNKKLVFFTFFFFLVLLLSFSIAVTCGDGFCETASENSCTCPEDCGKCEGPVSGKTCKEYSCEGEQCKIFKVMDCCGNGLCEDNEDYGNCPADCMPTSIEIEVLEPESEARVLRGQEFLIKTRITANTRTIVSADGKASGFFGELELFNDGKHGDENAFDSVYANTGFVEKGIAEGDYNIFISGSFRGVDGNTLLQLTVFPYLDIGISIDEQTILGNFIELNGTLKRDGNALEIPLDLNIVHEENIIAEETIVPDSDGNFFYSYRTSLIEEAGEWTISIRGKDEFGNIAFVQKNFTVLAPKNEQALQIELANSLEEAYSGYDIVELVFDVLDYNKKPVSGAQTKAIIGSEKTIELFEIKDGRYAVQFSLDGMLSAGEHEIFVQANKEIDGGFFQGTTSAIITVGETELEIEIIEPRKLSYQKGEVMPLKIKVSEEKKGLINDANAVAFVGGESINLQNTERGVYSGKYIIPAGEIEEANVFFTVADKSGNSANEKLDVKISGKSIFLAVLENRDILIAIATGLIVVLLAGGTAFFAFKKSKSLEQRKNELENLEKALQKSYFHEHEIEKREYDERMEKYENELKKISFEIERKKKK